MLFTFLARDLLVNKAAIFPDLFERSEFLIDTSQKKVCACARVPCARVHVCNNLGFSVWYYVPHTYVPDISSLSAGYQDTYMYLRTYVPGWGTYYVPHMYVNWFEHVCLYLVSAGSHDTYM